MTSYSTLRERAVNIDYGQETLSSSGRDISITFNKTRDDDNYKVFLGLHQFVVLTNTGYMAWVSAKTTTGMTVQVRRWFDTGEGIDSQIAMGGDGLIIHWEVKD